METMKIEVTQRHLYDGDRDYRDRDGVKGRGKDGRGEDRIDKEK